MCNLQHDNGLTYVNYVKKNNRQINIFICKINVADI